MTINHWEERDLETLEALRDSLDYGEWQEEVGKEGTPHLQVALCFKSARTFNGLKKLFPTAHIEKARNKIAALKYCSKKDTATGQAQGSVGRTDAQDKVEGIVVTKDPMEGLVEYEWQTKLREELDKSPDNRTIYWLWEPLGGAGKTTFVKHLVATRDDVLYIGGKASDIMYGVAKYVLEKKRGPKVVFMNIPRCVEHVSFNGLEQVKDGMFFNTKYECGMICYDCPHVVVMANEEPDYSKMSMDRWKVWRIDRDLPEEEEDDDDEYWKMIDIPEVAPSGRAI